LRSNPDHVEVEFDAFVSDPAAPCASGEASYVRAAGAKNARLLWS